MDKKEKKKEYKAPNLTAVTFKMERGYAFSMTFIGASAEDNEYMEAERHGYGTANNDTWF
jgi:hypothetical protein